MWDRSAAAAAMLSTTIPSASTRAHHFHMCRARRRAHGTLWHTPTLLYRGHSPHRSLLTSAIHAMWHRSVPAASDDMCPTFNSELPRAFFTRVHAHNAVQHVRAPYARGTAHQILIFTRAFIALQAMWDRSVVAVKAASLATPCVPVLRTSSGGNFRIVYVAFRAPVARAAGAGAALVSPPAVAEHTPGITASAPQHCIFMSMLRHPRHARDAPNWAASRRTHVSHLTHCARPQARAGSVVADAIMPHCSGLWSQVLCRTRKRDGHPGQHPSRALPSVKVKGTMPSAAYSLMPSWRLTFSAVGVRHCPSNL